MGPLPCRPPRVQDSPLPPPEVPRSHAGGRDFRTCWHRPSLTRIPLSSPRFQRALPHTEAPGRDCLPGALHAAGAGVRCLRSQENCRACPRAVFVHWFHRRQMGQTTCRCGESSLLPGREPGLREGNNPPPGDSAGQGAESRPQQSGRGIYGLLHGHAGLAPPCPSAQGSTGRNRACLCSGGCPDLRTGRGFSGHGHTLPLWRNSRRPDRSSSFPGRVSSEQRFTSAFVRSAHVGPRVHSRSDWPGRVHIIRQTCLLNLQFKPVIWR